MRFSGLFVERGDSPAGRRPPRSRGRRVGAAVLLDARAVRDQLDGLQVIAVVVEGPSSLRPAPRSGVATTITDSPADDGQFPTRLIPAFAGTSSVVQVLGPLAGMIDLGVRPEEHRHPVRPRGLRRHPGLRRGKPSRRGRDRPCTDTGAPPRRSSPGRACFPRSRRWPACRRGPCASACCRPRPRPSPGQAPVMSTWPAPDPARVTACGWAGAA